MSASPGDAPGGRSHHSAVARGCSGNGSRASGWAISMYTWTGVSAGRASSSWLMAGIAVSSPARRNEGASRSMT